ncbi:hypothetical protein D3C81_1795710 [compost metagenome]
MIIAPLASSFEHKTANDQMTAVDEIQLAARSAGLRGTVAVVWQSGGRIKFIGPRQWHRFLGSLSMQRIQMNLNKTLSW